MSPIIYKNIPCPRCKGTGTSRTILERWKAIKNKTPKIENVEKLKRVWATVQLREEWHMTYAQIGRIINRSATIVRHYYVWGHEYKWHLEKRKKQ